MNVRIFELMVVNTLSIIIIDKSIFLNCLKLLLLRNHSMYTGMGDLRF